MANSMIATTTHKLRRAILLRRIRSQAVASSDRASAGAALPDVPAREGPLLRPAGMPSLAGEGLAAPGSAVDCSWVNVDSFRGPWSKLRNFLYTKK